MSTQKMKAIDRLRLQLFTKAFKRETVIEARFLDSIVKGTPITKARLDNNGYLTLLFTVAQIQKVKKRAAQGPKTQPKLHKWALFLP